MRIITDRYFWYGAAVGLMIIVGGLAFIFREDIAWWLEMQNLRQYEVLFNRSGDIWLVRADGSDLRQLTNTSEVEQDAEWSPDGSQIVFIAEVGDGWDLFVMDADGSDRRQLLETEEEEYRPKWWREGDTEMITFVRPIGHTLESLATTPDGGSYIEVDYHSFYPTGEAAIERVVAEYEIREGVYGEGPILVEIWNTQTNRRLVAFPGLEAEWRPRPE